MKILVTGARGQLGASLLRLVAVHAAHEATGLAHGELDVTDAAAVQASLAEARPDVVVHCAALTDTTRCEREPAAARAVNALGAENVARACARAGARLVAISTNEVFDGETSAPYAEDAPARAVNAYGASKLDGERFAVAACPDTLIVRTSWLYGAGGNNFVEKVRAAAAAGRPLRFVTDEVASPTSTDDLAAAIVALIERRAPAGVYHLAGEGEASRYDCAREVLRLCGIGAPVEPVTTAELRAGGHDGPRKPPYSVLANTRARALGITMRPWRDALLLYLEGARVATDA